MILMMLTNNNWIGSIDGFDRREEACGLVVWCGVVWCGVSRTKYFSMMFLAMIVDGRWDGW
jgi:hypothetical protein